VPSPFSALFLRALQVHLEKCNSLFTYNKISIKYEVPKKCQKMRFLKKFYLQFLSCMEERFKSVNSDF
jgi:hypothetical protein